MYEKQEYFKVYCMKNNIIRYKSITVSTTTVDMKLRANLFMN